MKILIVDDHALFREGLCYVLYALEDSVTILEASNFDLAVQHVSENPDLDLVLLDLNMPGKDGFAALTYFTNTFSALPVVILSASQMRSDMQRSLDSGAMGFIPKDTTSEVMLNALRLIFSGGIYVPPNMAQQPIENHNNNSASPLTPRQLQVLEMLVQGHSNKVIAYDMDLAEATVKMHITSIFKSLGVSNRTQAALAAEKLGIARAC
jgi:DNA-binding NarL/FixJ family response regulator